MLNAIYRFEFNYSLYLLWLFSWTRVWWKRLRWNYRIHHKPVFSSLFAFFWQAMTMFFITIILYEVHNSVGWTCQKAGQINWLRYMIPIMNFLVEKFFPPRFYENLFHGEWIRKMLSISAQLACIRTANRQSVVWKQHCLPPLWTA